MLGLHLNTRYFKMYAFSETLTSNNALPFNSTNANEHFIRVTRKLFA